MQTSIHVRVRRAPRALELALASVLASVAALVAFGGASPAPARGDVIERVVAVVNDEAIFLSELRSKAAPRLPAAIASARSEADRLAAIRHVYDEELTHLIDEQLIVQAATAESIIVSSSDVENAINNVRAQTRLPVDQFWNLVRDQGFTEDEYRRDIRQQLLRYKVLNQRVRGRVNITEEDVRRRFDELVAQARRRSRFNAAFVLIAVPDGASATEVSALAHRANEVRSGLEDLDTFEAAMDDVGGGELGWLSEGDLEPELESALADLDVDEISAPTRGASGFFIFYLRERDTESGALPQYEDVRMDIYRQMLQDAMTRQERAFVEELRRAASIERRLEL
ncbi:MAG: SurA N-terminal domain-containing protein [Deltaproteobacteria bacterium]|nr:SurA N-terminal domain-containing protein [Deltaproteobacteria bacterium]